MTTEYQLNELTSAHEALIILIKGDVDVTEWTLRYRLNKGIYKGQKIGRDWFILTTELDRIQKEETGS